jgi:hypothetical protein
VSAVADARAKERRQKIIAAVGGAVLVALLLTQGPKMLRVFGGSAEAAPPLTEASSMKPAAGPSAQGAGPLAAALAAEQRVVRDVGRLYVFSRFPYKDPFAKPGKATPRQAAKPRRPARRQPSRPAPARRLRYTVIVHTVPASTGRKRAQSLARQVSARLGRRARVLRSSRQRTLRPGYWVVHVGSYRTRAAAAGTLQAARRVNRRAYIRPITP